MKLIEGVIVAPNGDDHVLVTIGVAQTVFNGMITLNATAAKIVDALQSETTEDALICLLMDTYGISYDTARDAVCSVLQELARYGLLAT